MIIIKLWGGLGNQLFQYAFGYSVAQKTGSTLTFDLTFYDSQSVHTGKREVLLDRLSLPQIERSFIRSFSLKVLNNRFVNLILRNLPAIAIPIGSNMRYMKETNHRYLGDKVNRSDTYFDGYWQTSKYFSEYREELLALFLPKDGFSKEVYDYYTYLSTIESVAVHIRKGDFGSSTLRKVGNALPIEYYQYAINHCKQQLTAPIFIIVSDDVAWAKQEFGTSDMIRYSEDEIESTALTDLYCIANCKHGIMSASTFSWWGNWLRKTEGIVVAPKGTFYNEYFFEAKWHTL